MSAEETDWQKLSARAKIKLCQFLNFLRSTFPFSFHFLYNLFRLSPEGHNLYVFPIVDQSCLCIAWRRLNKPKACSKRCLLLVPVELPEVISQYYSKDFWSIHVQTLITQAWNGISWKFKNLKLTVLNRIQVNSTSMCLAIDIDNPLALLGGVIIRRNYFGMLPTQLTHLNASIPSDR